MEQRVGVTLRWVRAFLLAAVVLGTGVVAHQTADGMLPSNQVLLTVLGVTTLVCAALLGRPATATRLVVLTVVGQTVVHAVLTAAAGHRGDHAAGATQPAAAPAVPTPPVAPPAPSPLGSQRSLLDVYQADVAQRGAGGGGGHGLTVPEPVVHLVTDMVDHAPMMLLHLVAAAFVALWLALGERALWTVLALVAWAVGGVLRLRALVVALDAGPVTGPRPRAGRRTPARPAHLLQLSRSVVRRGPPALQGA